MKNIYLLFSITLILSFNIIGQNAINALTPTSTGNAAKVNNENTIPDKYSLEQNYPNPFNPSTIIVFNLPENTYVSLKVYNTIGMEVASLVNGLTPAGTHEAVFNAEGQYSGVYFYTLKTGSNYVQTRKMILMK